MDVSAEKKNNNETRKTSNITLFNQSHPCIKTAELQNKFPVGHTKLNYSNSICTSSL